MGDRFDDSSSSSSGGYQSSDENIDDRPEEVQPEPTGECLVCKSVKGPDALERLRCGDLYCLECIDHMKRNNHSLCPLCRSHLSFGDYLPCCLVVRRNGEIQQTVDYPKWAIDDCLDTGISGGECDFSGKDLTDQNEKGFPKRPLVGDLAKFLPLKTEILNLSTNLIGAKGVGIPSERLARLSKLNVCGNPLGDLGFLTITNHLGQRLQELKAAGCGLGDHGAVALAEGLKRAKCHLRHLDISNNPGIGDFGIEALAVALLPPDNGGELGLLDKLEVWQMWGMGTIEKSIPLIGLCLDAMTKSPSTLTALGLGSLDPYGLDWVMVWTHILPHLRRLDSIASFRLDGCNLGEYEDGIECLLDTLGPGECPSPLESLTLVHCQLSPPLPDWIYQRFPALKAEKVLIAP